MKVEKNKLEKREIDIIRKNLSIPDVLHSALINVLGETGLTTDEEKPNVLTFDVSILPDDIEGIFHKYWLEQYPFMADRLEYKIEKKDVNTIVVEYSLNRNVDIRELVTDYIESEYEVEEIDDLGDDSVYYLCTGENDENNISEDILDYLACYGIDEDKIQLEIELNTLYFFEYYEFSLKIEINDE